MSKHLDMLSGLMDRAKKLGATSADAILSESDSVTVNRRLGKPESITRSEEAEVGLRVFMGKKQAVVSSSDLGKDALEEMVARAVAMAKAVPDDPYAGIAEPGEIATNFPDLDLSDTAAPDIEKMNELADRAEQAGMAVKGVTNSEGAEFNRGRDTTHYAASNGFSGSYNSTGYSLSVSLIAGKDTAMETDYAWDARCFLSDLDAPEKIGEEAGTRAVRALSPRKVPTKKVPVVYDWRVAGGLLGTLSGAITGGNVARGTTFLKEKMGGKIFSGGVTVMDDPFLARGARSRPFDGEGIAPQKRAIIDDGVLTGWLLDLSSARQLGLKSTGNAARGSSAPPVARCANFYMQPGQKSPEELIAEIEEGFFVTRLMGSSGNMVTGDYSRGAAGFWIENGKIAWAVSEVTIAGNLMDMWLNLTPANDLRLKSGVDAPTVRVDGMMVAGS